MKHSVFHRLGGPGRSLTTFQLCVCVGGGASEVNLTQLVLHKETGTHQIQSSRTHLSDPLSVFPLLPLPTLVSQHQVLGKKLPLGASFLGPSPHWRWAWGQGRVCVNQLGVCVASLLTSQRTVEKRFHGDTAGGPCQRERVG